MSKFLVRSLLGLAIAAMMLWCVGVLYYAPLLPESWRATAAGLFAALAVLAFLFLPRRGRTAIAAGVIFVVIVIAFLRIPASNDRDWQPEVGRTAYATIQGDMVTIHNIPQHEKFRLSD